MVDEDTWLEDFLNSIEEKPYTVQAVISGVIDDETWYKIEDFLDDLGVEIKEYKEVR